MIIGGNKLKSYLKWETNVLSVILLCCIFQLYFSTFYYLCCILHVLLFVLYFLCCIFCVLLKALQFMWHLLLISVWQIFSQILKNSVFLRVGQLGMIHYLVICLCLFQNYLSVSKLNCLLLFLLVLLISFTIGVTVKLYFWIVECNGDLVCNGTKKFPVFSIWAFLGSSFCKGIGQITIDCWFGHSSIIESSGEDNSISLSTCLLYFLCGIFCVIIFLYFIFGVVLFVLYFFMLYFLYCIVWNKSVLYKLNTCHIALYCIYVFLFWLSPLLLWNCF